jgi:predicted Ser/Thr protein kinase
MTQKKLGRYEIIGELGKGAMGLVYLAKDPLIGRQLAVKTFRVGFSAQDKELEQFHARFLREAQSAGILSHPNIVTIHDVAVDPEGDFFIAMEYVQGTDLKHLMQRRRLELPFVIQVVAQIADGLDYAHSKGVIHRDIKPANIIITKEQQAKITDFGIARVDASNLTTEGQLLGTPNYMAPEQIQAQSVDHRADLFSLGVMLYELVTGKKPFSGESLTQVTHRIVNEQPVAPGSIVPGLPTGLLQVIDRALQKSPQARYERGAEMARDLRAVLAPKSAAGTGSFLGDEFNPPTGAVPVQNPAHNMTMTSAAAHAALKPSSGSVQVPVTAESTVGGPLPAGSETVLAPRPATGSFAAPPAPQGVQESNRTLVIVVAVAVLVVVGAMGVSLLGSRSDSGATVTVEVDPEEEQRKKVASFLAEGRRLLLEDFNPGAAQTEFENALAIVPTDRKIRQLSRMAESLVGREDPVEIQVVYLVLRARQTLDERDYREAIGLAQEALGLDPQRKEAAQLLAEAEDRQGQRDKVRDRFRNETPPPPVEPSLTTAQQVPVSTEEDPAVEVAQATLEIAVEAEVAEGRITIFSGADQIFQESFKFPKRRSGVTGRVSKSLSVAAGPVGLTVYAKAKNEQTRSVDVQGDLASGGHAVVRIRVLSDGRVAAKLE